MTELNPKEIVKLYGSHFREYDDEFWKEKYLKDFGEFRIDLSTQSYKDRYLQVANTMYPSNWFGYYPDDENILNIVRNREQLPMRIFIMTPNNVRSNYQLIFRKRNELIDSNISPYNFSRLIQGYPVPLNGSTSSSSIPSFPSTPFSTPSSFLKTLMVFKDTHFALNVIKELKLDRLSASMDIVYDFLFCMIHGYYRTTDEWKIKSLNVNMKYSDQVISVISSCNLRQLLDVCYQPIVSKNHISILIYLITGLISALQSTSSPLTSPLTSPSSPHPHPTSTHSKRMSFLVSLGSLRVYYLMLYYLAKLANREIDEDSLPPYPPFIFVSLQEPDIILERQITIVDDDYSCNMLIKEHFKSLHPPREVNPVIKHFCKSMKKIIYHTIRLLLYLDIDDRGCCTDNCDYYSKTETEIIETQCGGFLSGVSHLLNFTNKTILTDYAYGLNNGKAYKITLQGLSNEPTGHNSTGLIYDTDTEHVLTIIDYEGHWLMIDGYLNCRKYTCRVISLSDTLFLMLELEKSFSEELWIKLTGCNGNDFNTERIKVKIEEYDYTFDDFGPFYKLIDEALERLNDDDIRLDPEYLVFLDEKLDPVAAENYLQSLYNLL